MSTTTAPRTRTDVILLVEDNPDDVTLTLHAFAKHDFDQKIVVARDGAQAIDLLFPEDDSEPPLRPAIILLDINLPKIGGLDVLRRIRGESATHAIPVIMLSTSSEDRDIAESYDIGANSYIRKPVMFGDFIEIAKTLGTYWLLLNQPSPNAD